MIWLLMALLAAFTWATVNYLDKFIVDKVSENKGVGSLVIFSGLAGLPVIIFTFLFSSREILTTNIYIGLWISLAGVFYLCYVLGYLYALSNGDVSTIVPQLLLAPIITVFLGYFFLGEVLTFPQVVGSILIISGAIILSANLRDLDALMKFKVLGFIIFASLFLSLNGIIFKYAVADEKVSFWATIFWEHLGFIIFAFICFVLVRSYRNNFLDMIRRKGNLVISTNIFSELLTLLGNFAAHYGTILAPVALVQVTADGIQPFFIILIGLIMTRFFPKIVSEDNALKSVITKVIAIILMCIGIVFVNR